MPIIEMPDGTELDLGDNPSPKIKAAVAAKFKELSAARNKENLPSKGPEMSVAGETPATETTPDTRNPDIGQIIKNKAFDPGGSAHAGSGTEEIVQGVQQQRGNQELKSMAARTLLPIAGGVVGALTPIPGGAAIGTGLGALAGDWIAQDGEIETGIREAFNPWRTAAEVFTAGYLSKFDAAKGVAMAAGKGALVNMGSDTIVSLAEGQGLPSTFELAVSALSGSILSGVGNQAGQWSNKRAAIKEMSGSDEVANRVATFLDSNVKDVPHPVGSDVLFRHIGQQERTTPGKIVAHELDENGEPNIIVQEDGVNHTWGRHMDDVELAPEGQIGLGLKPAAKQGELPLPPGEAQPELVGPTQLPGKPSKPKITKEQVRERSRMTDAQLKNQMGFDDLEEARGFEDLAQQKLGGNQGMNLGFADNSRRPWKVSEIGEDEQAEWARMRAQARGKEESLVSPLDRDAKFGDVSNKTRMMTVLGRPKDVFKRIEKETQLPVYEDYHNLSQAWRSSQLEATRDYRDVTATIHGTSDGDRNAIMKAFVDGGDFSNLPRNLQRKASSLWDQADKQLAQYDLTAEEYFGKYVPEIMKGKSIDDIILEGKAPAAVGKRLQYLAEDIKDDWISPLDSSLTRTMARLVDLGNYRKHIGDLAAEVSDKYNNVKSLKNNRGQPKDSLQFINTYLRSLKGGGFDPGAEKIDKVLGWVANKLPGDLDGRDLANKMVSLSYSGLLGMRPAAVLRNSMQLIQTGVPIFGPKNLARGLKLAMDPEGWKLAKAKGIIGVENVLSEAGERGKISEKVLWPYQKIEDFNRTVSYLSANAMFDNAVKKTGVGLAERTEQGWKALADKADIDMLSHPEQNVLAKMWDNGASLDDIKHIFSQGIVDDTQFMYMKPERAQALQSLGGRMALGFTNWPLSYASYGARILAQGPPRKRARNIARFAITNGALVGGYTAAGSYFGDKDSLYDNLGWTFLGPLFISGGPLVTASQAYMQAGREIAQGKPGRAASAEALIRTTAGFVPGGASAFDIYRAADKSKSGKEFVGRYLGFRRGQ